MPASCRRADGVQMSADGEPHPNPLHNERGKGTPPLTPPKEGLRPQNIQLAPLCFLICTSLVPN